MESTSQSAILVGPYRLGSLLGEGGMGAVYRGFHERLERPVALKRLQPEQSISMTARRRFLREAQAAARLNHPSVVQIYDIFRHEDDDWIAMELVEGESLAAIIKRAPVPWPRAAAIGQAVAAALEAAHGVAILHRDLKAENVIQAKSGEIKVLDFGLAKDLEAPEELDHSRTKGLAGTPRSLSPEQAMSLPLDHRSDLFSFGVLLYELLTASSPFHAKTLLAVLNNVCTARHTPVLELSPTVPAELSQLIDELLEKAPENRPPDARTVGARLRDIELAHSSRNPAESRRLSRPHVVGADRFHDTTEPSARVGSWSSETAGLEERRHLLVISCELQTDEPEELYEVFPDLQQAARALVRSRRGFFVDTPGSRLVACVGYPQAFEDDARTAVRIARALLEEVADFAASKKLDSLRVGCALHTGIAFTPAPQTAQQTGSGPELGSILDRTIEIGRHAAAGQLLVSAGAHPLLTDHAALREVDGPGDLGRLYEIPIDVDPDASDSQWLDSMSPPIGRQNEIRLLEDTFRSAAEGSFQVVQICGEGGIGKTKLLSGLRRELDAERPRWITLTGSPETANSPFFPLQGLLERIFGVSGEMTVDEMVNSLDSRVQDLGLADDDLLSCLAPLLSQSLEGVYPAPALSPDERKQRVLEGLTNLLESAGDAPTILAVEDLHWLDPSSLEWITLLIEERAVPSLLLVLTFRPHFVPPWGHRADVIQLNLNPLSKGPTRRLVEKILGGSELPQDVIDTIIAKTDGVPLFLEQMTRAVLEAGGGGEDGARSVQIPGSLRASLMARLDRLGPAKTVAQFASVVGRDFPLRVLQAIFPFDEATLEAELKHLTDAGIVMRRGLGQRARLVFKHALIRDAAYESLLRKDRRKLHQDIVKALREYSPKMAARNPELLARHCTLGGLMDDAVEYWQRAAKESLARSANLEAISHCDEGLRALESTAEPATRRSRELELREMHVAALTAAKGFAAQELGVSLRRLEELATQADDATRMTIALRGLVYSASYAGDSASVREYSDRFLAHAKELDDPLLIMEAYFQSSVILMSHGDLAQARVHAEECLALESHLEDDDIEPAARDVGRSRVVSARSFLALILWLQGAVDRAMATTRMAVELAPDADPLCQASARLNAASLLLLIGASEEAREHARAAIGLSEKHELFTRLAAQITLDLIELRGEDPAESEPKALHSIDRALTELQASGARFSIALLYCHLADRFLDLGKHRKAEKALNTAAELIDASDEQVWRPELLTVRGRLHHAKNREEQAEHALEEAIRVARGQGARSFELRSTLELARQGHAEGARDRLRDLAEGFSEGFTTPDLVATRQLLSDG